MKPIIIVLTIIVLGACNADPPDSTEARSGDGTSSVAQPPPEPSKMLSEGEAFETQFHISYLPTSLAADDGDGSLWGDEICEHKGMHGTVAVIEIVGEERDAPGALKPGCDRPYSEAAGEVAVKVLANASGPAVPEALDAVWVGLAWLPDVPRRPGIQLLVSLREDDEQWFVLAAYPLEVSADALATQNPTQLPTSFSDLVRELKSAPPTFCDGKSIDDTWGWPAVVRDPSLFGPCNNSTQSMEDLDYPPRDGD